MSIEMPKSLETTTTHVVNGQEMGESAEWDAFVQNHAAAHLLQTSAWGQLKSHFGWTSRTIVDGPTQINQGALLLFRSMLPGRLARVLPHSLLSVGTQIAYIPKGPLVDWHDHSATANFWAQTEAVCRKEGAALLKIEPDLPDTPANRKLLQGYGFVASQQNVQPQSTIILDIVDDEEVILQRMKSKWRYNIRLAMRKEVEVRACTAADLPAFHQLMQETGLRDGFHVHSAEYFNAAFHLLVPDKAVYLLAEYRGEPLAAIVVCITGKTAWYLWGASSNRERNRMPNHALQWAAIRWARAHGATRYDLWGIPDEVGQMALTIDELSDESSEVGVPVDKIPLDLQALPKGELWGVYRLKQGFGGNVVRFVGAWDKPLDSIGYGLYKTGYRLQKFWTARQNQQNSTQYNS